MSLTQIAFFAFAAIAAGGLLMAGMMIFKIAIPAFLGPAHGLGGLASLALLFTANVRNPATPALAWWALGAFASGLVGGLLFFRVLFKDRAPLLLVAGHGSLAGIGLCLLYGPAFSP